MTPKRAAIVVGTRPNFMKGAPVHRRLREHPGFEPLLLHTGQHFDDEMNQVFFRELGLPEPDLRLDVESADRAGRLAAVLTSLAAELPTLAPDLVAVVGDVDSTLAGALAAAKLGIPVAHVEAGLRSFDRTMPEELNRALVDRIGEWLFVTEESGRRNLLDEGIPEERIHLVGNVMIDTLARCRELAAGRPVLERAGVEPREYVLLTAHRPANVDRPEAARALVGVVEEVAARRPVVFPVHPRTESRIREFGLEERLEATDGLTRLPPLGYLDFLALMDRAGLVLTDSGGIQEETTYLGVPCLTMRESTERPVTVELGTNRLAPVEPERVVAMVETAFENGRPEREVPPLWDGRAADRIVEVLARELLAVLLFLGLLAGPAAAQEAPDSSASGPTDCRPRMAMPGPTLSSAGDDRLRLAEISGKAERRATFRSTPAAWDGRVCVGAPGMRWAAWSQTREAGQRPTGPSWRLAPTYLHATANSAYPRDRNNGLLWSGKGLSTLGSAGLRLRWGPVSVDLAPEYAYQQNEGFRTVDRSPVGDAPFRYPWYGGIDWPERFGPTSFGKVHPGQSRIAVAWGPVTAGVSTGNEWWGPARRYPILLGNSGPGFRHVYAGTPGPVDVHVGELEARLLWGDLDESAHFDRDGSNDRRRLNGVVVAFRPAGFESLTLGAMGFLHSRAERDGSGLGDFLGFLADPFSLRSGNVQGNGLGGLFMRWVLEDSGFEAYAEWARDDFAWDFWDLMGEPDHSQAYVLGLQKVTGTDLGALRVGGELASLTSDLAQLSGRGTVKFYTHSRVSQGHTHRGQLLGAWIGPGSSAWYLEADLFTDRGSVGLFFERVAWDQTAYYQRFVRQYGFRGHDVEVLAGLRGSFLLGELLVDGTVSVARRRNRSFIGLDGSSYDFREETNVFGELMLSWWPEVAREWQPLF